MATPNPASHRPRLRFELVVIAAGVVALSQSANGFITPALPRFIQSLNGSAVMLGLVISMFSIARLITNIPAGVLAERIGRKKVLLGGAIITAVFSTLSGTANSLPLLLFYRFLVGIGSAATITAGIVAVTDLSTRENRGRALGILQGWQFIGGIVSPGIGGFLAQYAGLRAPFFASGIGVLILAAWALLRLPETKPTATAPSALASKAEQDSGSSQRAVLQLLRQWDFMLISLVAFSIFFSRFGASQSIVPLKAYALGWTPGAVGLLFSAGAVVNAVLIFPAAYISDRFGRKATIVPSGVGAALGLAFMSVSGGSMAFIASYMVINATTAFGGPTPSAYVGDISNEKQRGLSLGVYRTFGDLAGVVGPIITTAFVGWFSYTAAFLLSAGVELAAHTLFGLFAHETAGKHRRVEAAPRAA